MGDIVDSLKTCYSQGIKKRSLARKEPETHTYMFSNDKLDFAGSIDIRVIDKNGHDRLIWQEFSMLHYIRKHFGINFPKIFGLTGYLTRKAHYANLITTAGKGLISGRINGVGTPAAPTAMAIGTGVTAANVADVTLGTELTTDNLGRGAGTASLQTTTVTNDTCRLVKSWTSTRVADVAVTEMGILNNATSGGTLMVRNVFSAYTLRTNDTFEITHNLKNA